MINLTCRLRDRVPILRAQPDSGKFLFRLELPNDKVSHARFSKFARMSASGRPPPCRNRACISSSLI
jgi:hypothetical protein